MGGHSDVQGGAIVVRDDVEFAEHLKHFRTLTGGVLAPFNAWLISRGLQTLYCRMEQTLPQRRRRPLQCWIITRQWPLSDTPGSKTVPVTPSPSAR